MGDAHDKKALSERDICTKYITPAIARAGWDVQVQVREEVHLTQGRVIVRGKLVTRDRRRVTESGRCSSIEGSRRSLPV